MLVRIPYPFDIAHKLRALIAIMIAHRNDGVTKLPQSVGHWRRNAAIEK